MQLELNTATWDLELGPDGNIRILSDSDPAALLSQRICHRLRTFQGECYLDRSVGVPYFSEVLKKRPDLGHIRSLLVSVIRSVPGVLKVLALNLDYRQGKRVLRVQFNVQGDGFTAAGEV